MSDEKIIAAATETAPESKAVEQSGTEGSIETQETVAYDTYQKVLNQRKADQKKAKEAEDRAKQLEESIKKLQNRELEEKQEYKKLYEATLAEKDAMKREQEERNKIMVNKEKQAALAKELGGLKNDAYYRFADLNNIVIDDSGQVDSNSVRLEANRFRQTYPELVLTAPAVRVNSQAPSTSTSPLNHQKAADKMNAAEREQAKREHLIKNLKR